MACILFSLVLLPTSTDLRRAALIVPLGAHASDLFAVGDAVGVRVPGGDGGGEQLDAAGSGSVTDGLEPQRAGLDGRRSIEPLVRE